VPAADALKLLCLVGIGKAIGFFTGPVLFAASRPRYRAIMLWILAIVSTASVVSVGLALKGSGLHTQVLGMAGSRALLFVPILIPVNLLIVARMTGMRLSALLPGLPGPFLAGLAGIAAERLVRYSGIVDNVAAVPALLVVGTVSSLTAMMVLLLLVPVVRQRVGAAQAQLRAALRARRLAPVEGG
jgi:hypothetical protein